MKLVNIKRGDNGLPICVHDGREFAISKEDAYTTPRLLASLCTLLEMNRLVEEYVYVIMFDDALHIVGISEVSHGTVTISLCSPREIFQRALMCGATRIALVHNHPSQDPSPSDYDVDATRKIKEAGNMIGIGLVEHLIYANDNCFYSMAEHGMM